MFVSFILSLSLTFTSVTGTIEEDELKWAFDYLTQEIKDTEYPTLLPNGVKVNFPDPKYEGLTLKNNKHKHHSWYDEPVPLGGSILLKKDWSYGSIHDRAILLHEACHILDLFTKNGCNCDPYTIQYYYMYSNDFTLEQIRLLYWFQKHDPSRSCNIR